MSTKPLPLKQRTSSVDPRRDYSSETWVSVLGLLKLREFFVTVDHFSIWRRHLAWAMDNGKELRGYMTQRYASSMVFLSLLLGTELNVLFNSAAITTTVRQALMDETHTSVSFWAGIAIIVSAVLTLIGLISTFTAWTMVSAVSDDNVHCVFRSSIGQYIAELPGRFIVASIYSFFIWLLLFFFLLMPFGFWSVLLLVLGVGLFVHTIAAFSAFGRVIMHTGAMGSNRIFEPTFESSLLPHSLHSNLLLKARANLSNSTSIRRQYASKAEPISRHYISEDELSVHLSDRGPSYGFATPSAANYPSPVTPATRKRTESLVKFADGYDTNGDRFEGPQGEPTTSKQGDSNTSSLPTGMSTGTQRPPRPIIAKKKKGATSPPDFEAPIKEGSDEGDDGSTKVFSKWLSSSSASSFENLVVGADSLGGSRIEDRLESSVRSGDSMGYFPPIPAQVAHSRSASVVSSLDGAARDSDRFLTDDEKFDEEYGGLFDPPENARTPSDGSPEQNKDLEKGDPEKMTLLADGNSGRGNYSSIQNSSQRGSLK